MDKITLTGMDFFGYHGALPEENALGQRFVVDLVMYLDLQRAGKMDDLSASVNYAEAYRAVKKIVEGLPYKTIEAVAESIAAVLRTSYSQIERLRVTVHKPGAPIAGIFQDVSVTIER